MLTILRTKTTKKIRLLFYINKIKLGAKLFVVRHAAHTTMESDSNNCFYFTAYKYKPILFFKNIYFRFIFKKSLIWPLSHSSFHNIILFLLGNITILYDKAIATKSEEAGGIKNVVTNAHSHT